MKLPRSLKFALLSLAVLLATGLGYGVYLLANLAPIGAAYAAKTLCSAVFVSGRAAPDAIREDIRAENHPLLRFILPDVDTSRRIASATFLGLAHREAHYRPGLGCTIAIGAIKAVSAPATTPSTSEPDGLEAGALAGHVDAAKLQGAIDDAFAEPDPAHLRRTRALVVIQDGRIVAERYAPGFSAITPLPGWSMTKTVAGVLIGTLVKAGKLAPEQKGLVPEWRSAGDPRAEITLDQLLRMTSGLRFSENYGDPLEDVALMLFARADGAGYAIDKPLEVAPGARWRYSSGTSNILSRIMRIAVGGSEQDYLAYPHRALFDRIGMRSALIEPDSSGNLVTSSFMYAGARDWARLGQFLLQNGVWNGERILSDGWVKYMASLTPQSKRGDFGAHLWVKVPPPFNGTAAERSRIPSDAFHAVGYEAQFVSVIPSKRLVVVRLGLSRFERAWNHDAFLARLLEAFPE
ncbi:MAG TPA: serine hydrolase [Burkholderiales bacterium]|nr:serine hydrolase [Burkholderiales bacterium]